MKARTLGYLMTCFMAILYMLVLMIFGGSINIVSLPWISLMSLALAISIVFGMWGHYILARILPKSFCPCVLYDKPYIEDNIVIIPNIDSTVARYVGLVFFKLKPTIPISDMREEEKKSILEKMESFLIGLPVTVRYCVVKTVDPVVMEEIKKISKELTILERRQQKVRSPELERKIRQYREELERLMKTKTVAAIKYMVVYIEGNSIPAIKRRAKEITQLIEFEATKIACIAKPVSGFELQDLLNMEVIGRLALR